MAFCIGLTGGIGSGKSSAAGLFQELGAGVVDTDQIAHELTGPGGAAIAAIRSQFGADYIAADGGLDRAGMRRLVFGNPAAKQKLEALLHPLIREQALAQIAEARQPYVLVAVPLLFETGAYRELVSRVLVVDCPEEMQRSRLTADEVRAIMAAQLPRSERLARADDVLHNDDDMDALRRQVAILHDKYLALARPS